MRLKSIYNETSSVFSKSGFCRRPVLSGTAFLGDAFKVYLGHSASGPRGWLDSRSSVYPLHLDTHSRLDQS